MNQSINKQQLKYGKLSAAVNDLFEELVIANKELALQNDEKEQRAAELVIANKELALQNDEKEQRAAELVIANKELALQNAEKEQRAAELVIANKELALQNDEKEQRAAELVIANKELALQNAEKEQRAAELVIANKELALQNAEKEQRAAELVIANKELAFQNAEKEQRAAELVVANEELVFQNDEKKQRAAELVVANEELVFQNDEKEQRAAELVVANEELAFQSDEKKQRAAELVIANKELAFQNAEKEQRAAELVVANEELVFQNDEKEQRAAELVVANEELAFQSDEKKQRAAELVVANEELAFQSDEKKQLLKNNSELRIAAAVFESQEGMMITDANTVILRVNTAFTRINGYSAGEVIGKTPKFLQSGHHNARFYTTMWESINRTGGWKGEIWNQNKSGDIYPEYLIITAVQDQNGLVTNYVATYTDIRITKSALAEVERLAFYDPLTGLPNRRLLRERLKLVLATNHRNDEHAALLFMDMDHFKTLNDTLGHDIGDLLLQQVAHRLSSCVREVDTVARLGGDEFVVLLTELSEQTLEAAAQADVIGHKLLRLLNEPYQLGTHDYLSSSSIGVTVFSDRGVNIDELLKQADIAMYEAKTSGRNALRFFDPQMQININARVLLEADLRLALAENQFELYYQAQTTHDGFIIGAEALIRWQHPQRGLIFPDTFISLAEDVGLITAIGQWVLETACAQLKIWEDNAHTQHLQLAVNVSARQFHQADFIIQVRQILSDTAINPARLKLELTESLVIDNVNDTIFKMNTLRENGVRFSMDDFGTGFSSLSYLTRLPLDQLKIDKSFVHNISVKPSDMIIIQTIIGMVHNLGMEVIAEGVETEEQRAFLEQNDCPLYQGYLFSKPVPIEQFEALLVQHIKSMR